MPRKQDPKIGQAKIMFENGKKLIEISQELGVPEGTVRSWKNRYKWDSNEDNATLQKKEQKKRNVAKSKSPPKVKKQEEILDEVESVMKNSELTDKQKLFCVNYIKCFNAVKAYQRAYKCSYMVACGHAHELLKKVEIKNEIMRLKQGKINQAMISPEDIFQKYMDIAFSDITDYLTFGKKTIEYVDKAGNEHEVEVSYVDLNESSQVDGTLISEVKQGKDGVSIKLADRMKALAWIADHMDLATEEQKARIALLKAKVTQDDEDEEQEDDGFIEALKGQVSGVWDE